MVLGLRANVSVLDESRREHHTLGRLHSGRRQGAARVDLERRNLSRLAMTVDHHSNRGPVARRDTHQTAIQSLCADIMATAVSDARSTLEGRDKRRR